MKRLILLVLASLLIASPASARKEKVYRIEWSEWGLKDGMNVEEIAKQLDKNGVKYRSYDINYNNHPFPNKHFWIDTVSRWGITWDKVIIRTHGRKLADVYYTRNYKDKNSALDVASVLNKYFEEKNGFTMGLNILEISDGICYSIYLHYTSDLYMPYHFSISVSRDIFQGGYQLAIDIYTYHYNPWLM